MLQTDTMPGAEALLHQNLKEICRPVLPQEHRLRREIEVLCPVLVTVMPNTERFGAEPGRSHLNCYSFALQDPEHKARAVTGWMETGIIHTCRSVIYRDGQWLCLTPTQGLPIRCYEFRPDPSLEHRPVFEGKAGRSIFRIFRNGTKLTYPVVRKWPDEIRRLGLAARRRLRDGELPPVAMRQLREELAALVELKVEAVTLQ